MTAGAIATRAALLGLPLVGAAIGLAAPDSVLFGGLAWFGLVLAALAGWGHAVAWAAQRDDGLALRLAWGTAAITAAAGPLLAVGALTQGALLALLALGFLGHGARVLTRPAPSLAPAWTWLRADPERAIAWMSLGALVLLRIADACAYAQTNVYDDDVAYTPMVKRLLDIGDLEEPFSFRRISAYGGQTVLAGLFAARGTLDNPYLLDHGLGHLLTIALVVGLARRHRADGFVTGLTVLVLVLLPDTSINTASYWTGAALFLALYRSVAEGEGSQSRGWLAAGLVAGALCTLRQNYIPVAVGFLGLALVVRLERPFVIGWRRERAAWLAAAVGGMIAVVPFAVASWRSNHTFLYPFQLGTFNPAIQMKPTVWTAWQELEFFLRVAFESEPFRVVVPLVPFALIARDRRPGRPLLIFALASAAGFALLVHSFTLSDPPNLWRYAFGYSTALIAAMVIEAAGPGLVDRAEIAPGPVELPLTGRVVVIACLIAQLVTTSKPVARRFASMGPRLAAAARTHLAPNRPRAVPALYRDLQAAVPAGSSLLILLDEPAHLDYARNRIISLDVPGYASYRPGLPSFRGPEALADYLRGHALRYVAFVRGSHSRYFYRREFWVARVMWDTELWQVMGAYVIDALDNLAALAERYPVRFERDGHVVVDLGTVERP